MGFLDEIDDLNARVIRHRAKKMVGVEKMNMQYNFTTMRRI